MSNRISENDLEAAVKNINDELGRSGRDSGSYVLYTDSTGWRLDLVGKTGGVRCITHCQPKKDLMEFLDGMYEGISAVKVLITSRIKT